ncbi:TRAP transporter substrate-binding protein [Oceanobacillus senegalensis]|uniref:TRAP transporter substrate-binding protein n=1 Tax=Oceanobacillus senegalensis TaxID=1936063 RepID=UPI001FE70143|nr:TRAP transporter substrate-binding protein DctP [Oceanobacillus senegalensis]
MKKFSFTIFSLFFILMVLVACSDSSSGENESANNGSGTGAAGEVYELDINNWQSSSHHYAYNVWEPWKELVEEKTNGRINVNIHHGSALGKSSSVYQDVSGGLYDVSLVVANYFYDTNFFPYTIGNLPFAFEGPEVAADVLKEFGEKYANEDLSQDIIVMPPTSTDGYDLFSTEPIRSIEDLEDLKMRVNGKSENAFVEALDGVPVSLSTEDTYEGLERGMIDTAFYTPIGAVGIQYYEPAPYITQLAVSVTPVVPIMNKEFYESLPEDLQQIFDEELNPALTDLFTESYVTELESSHEELKEVVEGRGEFITLDDTEFDRFRELGKSAWEAWIEDANSKGYDGQAMVDDFFNILEESDYPLPF